MKTECLRHSAVKSALISMIALALTLLICAGVRPLRGAQHAAVASTLKSGATVTPFTLKTRLLFFEEQSPYTHLTMQLTARRADGTTVMLAYRPGMSEERAHVRTIAYPDGRRTEVLDEFRAVTKWPRDPKVAAATNRDFVKSWDECRDAPGEYVAGHATLDGVNAVIVKAFPKRSSGTTWWRAPQLGCADLQQTYTEVQADGSFKLVTEAKLVTIQLGPPDRALFSVPSNYANVKPSQALHLEAKLLGHKWDADLQAQGEREDAEYERLQTAKSDQ